VDGDGLETGGLSGRRSPEKEPFGREGEVAFQGAVKGAGGSRNDSAHESYLKEEGEKKKQATC